MYCFPLSIVHLKCIRNICTNNFLIWKRMRFYIRTSQQWIYHSDYFAARFLHPFLYFFHCQCLGGGQGGRVDSDCSTNPVGLSTKLMQKRRQRSLLLHTLASDSTSATQDPLARWTATQQDTKGSTHLLSSGDLPPLGFSGLDLSVSL